MATIPQLFQFFDRLTVIGPWYGHFPEKSKSILIVNPTSVERAKDLTGLHTFKVITGLRYLGEFIGEKEAQTDWIKRKSEKWANGAS